MDRLKGRTAVVTGAASGNGLAIVEAFLSEGMGVVMADIDSMKLGVEVERLEGTGAQVIPAVVDVSDPEDVERAGRLAILNISER